MDRRQRKTREAIFKAFLTLLEHKKYSCITVGEIIEMADVGRATFYSHFETKDYLLKELCTELFCHVFDSIHGNVNEHKHIFECDISEDIFLHLFRHLENNDNHIFTLLVGENNEFFLDYFKKELKRLIAAQTDVAEFIKNKNIPGDFWINHVSCCFVETVRWWFSNKSKCSAETIYGYFVKVLDIG